MHPAETDSLFAEVLQSRVFYAGRVQGVGFRQQTYAVALEFDLSGWVRNLPDGRVELVVEGKPQTVENFLRTLENRLCGFIRNSERSDLHLPPTLQGFTIK